MQLSKKTDQALRLLMFVASRAPHAVRLAEVARVVELSHANLKKFAAELSSAGLLETARGRAGGVRLGRAAGSISIGEVVRLLEPLELVECFGEGGRCRFQGGCGLQGALGRAQRAFLAELDGVSLAQVVEGSRSVLERLEVDAGDGG